ncbi:Hypothetical predicted protein [Prunus dulcis]|uniref:Uncharacterized protein n=1 Tax=Prunus dulcis TaxID=3755 RepID=A0A5E4E726_PRUDU|nr:Hypothetical predicted protein [Prunus dulcis]
MLLLAGSSCSLLDNTNPFHFLCWGFLISLSLRDPRDLKHTYLNTIYKTQELRISNW